MHFTGYSEHSIDAKQRLAIPAKYRALWDEKRDGKAWYGIPWPGGVLRLYTENVFNELAGQMGSRSLAPGRDEASLDSSLFGFSERLEMDKQGRVALPKLHLELTGLNGEVVIVGARNRLEVYGRAGWLATMRERFERLPELAERLTTGSPTGIASGGPVGGAK
jgi:MraZ protein